MKNQKILIIDDDSTVRSVLQFMLREEGYQVLTAAGGGEGLETALRDQPDLIVADILMPGMNGFDLCCKIKENPAVSHIPVILMTAVYKGAEFVQEGRKAGAADFIEKPLEKGPFLERIERLLPLPGDRTSPEFHLPLQGEEGELRIEFENPLNRLPVDLSDEEPPHITMPRLEENEPTVISRPPERQNPADTTPIPRPNFTNRPPAPADAAAKPKSAPQSDVDKELDDLLKLVRRKK